MGFKEWIIPQDRVFYDLFDKFAHEVREAVVAFQAMLQDWNDLDAKRDALKAIEHHADEIGHEIFDRLGRSFITPIDRDDIIRLTHSLDDVVDYVHAAGNRIFLYELEGPTAEMHEFIAILKKQCDEIVPAVQKLRRRKTMPGIKENTIEIHRLENEADRLLNRTIAALYKSRDAVHILKHKDVYEYLETATDSCEDVADALNDILRKQSA